MIGPPPFSCAGRIPGGGGKGKIPPKKTRPAEAGRAMDLRSRWCLADRAGRHGEGSDARSTYDQSLEEIEDLRVCIRAIQLSVLLTVPHADPEGVVLRVDERELATEAILLLQHRNDFAVELGLELFRLAGLDLEFHVACVSHRWFPSVVSMSNSLNVPPLIA